jgi:hypothetical protein
MPEFGMSALAWSRVEHADDLWGRNFPIFTPGALGKNDIGDPDAPPHRHKVQRLPMPKINFDSGVPSVLKIKYKYAPFGLDRHGLQEKIQAYLGSKGVANAQIQDLIHNWNPTVTGKIEKAWGFISRVAARSEKCNKYFKSLPKGKTLRQILQEDHITIHCLVPKDGYTFADVVAANTDTGGPHIGIHPDLIIFTSESGFPGRNLKGYDSVFELASTLVHELAHVAGATTNASDEKHGLDAENSLPPCGCGKADSANVG